MFEAFRAAPLCTLYRERHAGAQGCTNQRTKLVADLFPPQLPRARASKLDCASMLTETQAAELRALLEQDRGRILSAAQDASSFSRDRDRTRMGRDSVDESAQEALYGTKLRLADRDSETLNAIEMALARLDGGSLGECEECEELISFARLRARPMSRLCIECQEDREEQP